MNLKEKMQYVNQQVLEIDENMKRKIRKNLLKNYKSIDVGVKICVLRIKKNLLYKDLMIDEDTIWLFLNIACATGFKNGTNDFGKALYIAGIKESKIENLFAQNNFNTKYAKELLMHIIKQVHIQNSLLSIIILKSSEEVEVDLDLLHILQ